MYSFCKSRAILGLARLFFVALPRLVDVNYGQHFVAGKNQLAPGEISSTWLNPFYAFYAGYQRDGD